jgi:hypothetical protein
VISQLLECLPNLGALSKSEPKGTPLLRKEERSGCKYWREEKQKRTRARTTTTTTTRRTISWRPQERKLRSDRGRVEGRRKEKISIFLFPFFCFFSSSACSCSCSSSCSSSSSSLFHSPSLFSVPKVQLDRLDLPLLEHML